MRILNLEMIKTNNHVVKPTYKENKTWDVIGLDTETYKGKVTLISDSTGKYKIIKNLDELLDFLMHKNYRKTINFFFNLEYDTNAILKHLDNEKLNKIIYYNNVILYSNIKGLIKIEVIPKKCLKISYLRNKNDKIITKDTVKFFDISSFYKLGSLEKTYNKIFPDKIFKKSLDASKEFPISKINKEDIEYCINDSKACYELAKNFVDMTNTMVTLKDYYSPASISKAMIRQNLKYPYKFKPTIIQNYGLKTYAGGRFEVMKRGYFNKLYMADINSAYPYIISKLYETEGQIKSNKTYEDDALYSFMMCDVRIDECIISPLKFFMDKMNLLAYPIGNFYRIYITKPEYELLKNLDIDINIISAKHLINEQPNKPFEWVEKIYKLRKDYKNANDRRELILKLAMNSIYGCTIQTIKKYEKRYIDDFNDKIENIEEFIYCPECHYEILENGEFNYCPKCKSTLQVMFRVKTYNAGQFFNPIYATTITSNIRCKLFMDSMRNKRELEKDIVMYATDSITYTKKPKHLNISEKLGDYSLTNELEGLIIGSGIYSLEDKKGKKYTNKQKFRGFGNQDVKEIALNHMEESEYTYIKKTPYKLKESKKDLSKINIFAEKEKKLILNFDRKRQWDYEAKTFKDLLENQIESKPLTIK